MAVKLGKMLGGAIFLILSGCSAMPNTHFSSPENNETSSIQYQFSVSTEKNGVIRARDELDAYLFLNQNALAVYGADIKYHGTLGHKLAQKTYRWLLTHGTPQEKLTISDTTSLGMNVITLNTHVALKGTTQCISSSSQHAKWSEQGCVIETLQWENRVYPEQELAGDNVNTHQERSVL